LSNNEYDLLYYYGSFGWWNYSDFMCKNHILNTLDNTQYNIYSSIKSVKALLKTLDKNFKVEIISMKKFKVDKFSGFKMVDSRIIMSQVQEFQITLHDNYAKEMLISENFQVTTIIKKFSPSWKEFKN
jgi:hypothetical protein